MDNFTVFFTIGEVPMHECIKSHEIEGLAKCTWNTIALKYKFYYSSSKCPKPWKQHFNVYKLCCLEQAPEEYPLLNKNW
jgi:hypothetical protein